MVIIIANFIDNQEVNPKSKMFDPNYNPIEEREREILRQTQKLEDNKFDMPNSFRQVLNMDKKPVEHVKNMI